MELISMLLLPALVILGIITTYQDLAHGKIRNLWISIAILYGLLTIGALFFMDKLTSGYVFSYGINLLITICVAFLIWLANLWSAGDAKLCMAYSALIPLSFYEIGTGNYFPSFALLFNTFVPFLFVYFTKALFQTNIQTKIKVLKKGLQPHYIIKTALFIFFLTWISTVIFPFVASFISINPFLFSFIVIFIVLFLFRNEYEKKHLALGIFFAILAVFFGHTTVLALSFLMQFISLVILFIFIKHFVLQLGFEVFSHPVFIEKLEPGMVLAENFTKKYQKIQINPLNIMATLFQKKDAAPLFSSSLYGITEKEVKEMRRLHNIGKIKSHTVRIFQTAPFAPFMFFGSLLTLLF